MLGRGRLCRSGIRIAARQERREDAPASTQGGLLPPGFAFDHFLFSAQADEEQLQKFAVVCHQAKSAPVCGGDGELRTAAASSGERRQARRALQW